MTSIQRRLADVAASVGSGGAWAPIVVRASLDDMVVDYVQTLNFQMRRLSQRNFAVRPTMADWLVYLELLLLLRVSGVHAPDAHRVLRASARVPTFYALALAATGLAKGMGYKIVPTYEPRFLARSMLTQEPSPHTGQDILVLEKSMTLEVALENVTQIAPPEDTGDGDRDAGRKPLYMTVKSVAGFITQMSDLLENAGHHGVSSVRGIPKAEDGDFDFMMFMRAEEAEAESNTVWSNPSAFYHFRDDVEPGKAVMAAFFRLQRLRTILNPVIPYSGTMTGDGGYSDLLRLMAQI